MVYSPVEWIVYLFGPSGTCFEGASFMALMRFPADYPHAPPSLQILSEIIHPNIFRDGKVCISTLQVPHPGASAEESKLNWSAVLGVSGALQSVVSLLADPNPDDPANPEAARLFVTNRAAFEKRARECSERSKGDLPQGFVRPIVVVSSFHPAPGTAKDSASQTKHRRTSYEEDEDGGADDDEDEYSYDTDEQLELEQQAMMEESAVEGA